MFEKWEGSLVEGARSTQEPAQRGLPVAASFTRASAALNLSKSVGGLPPVDSRTCSASRIARWIWAMFLPRRSLQCVRS